MVSSPNHGKKKKRIGTEDDAMQVDALQATSDAPSEVPSEVSADGVPDELKADSPEGGDAESAPKKKRRRRRRRRKKKTEAPADATSENAEEQPASDSAEASLEDVSSVEETTEEALMNEPVDVVQEDDSSPAEDTNDPFSEPIFPDEKPGAQGEENAVWDSFDDASKEDTTTPEDVISEKTDNSEDPFKEPAEEANAAIDADAGDAFEETDPEVAGNENPVDLEEPAAPDSLEEPLEDVSVEEPIESDTATDLEASAKPETPTEPEASVEPEAPTEPEVQAEPEQPEQQEPPAEVGQPGKSETPQKGAVDEGDVPDWLKSVPSEDWNAAPTLEKEADPFAAPEPAVEQPAAAAPEPTIEAPVETEPLPLTAEEPAPEPASVPPLQPTEPEPVVPTPQPEVHEPEPVPTEFHPEPATPAEQVHEAAPASVPDTAPADVPKEPEPTPQPPMTEPVLGSFEHDESFADKVQSMMQEAGISFKSLIRGIIIVLVVLIGGYYLISYAISFFSSSSPDTPVKVPVEDTTPAEPEPSAEWNYGIGASEIMGYWDFGKETLYPIQAPATSPPTPVQEGGSLSGSQSGTPPVHEMTNIQPFVFTLKEIQNAFETDIYALLDRSTDRLTTLNTHINLMTLLEAKAGQQMQELDVQLAELEQKFSSVTSQKQAIEREFFDNLRQLEPALSDNKLTKFSALSREQVVLKADFQARKKIRRYFDLLVENLSNRKRDYEVNKDALVKGVKVVDVKGSNINLILKDE